jgi:hypothetical protein
MLYLIDGNIDELANHIDDDDDDDEDVGNMQQE